MQCLEGSTKYHRWYNAIISKRLNLKPSGYSETHHITPRCLGGTDAKENLIELTAREHYICHLLLVKMFESEKHNAIKLIRAFLMMSHCASPNHKRVRFNSKIYSSLREKFSELLSQQMKGNNNPSWNTTWIFNPEYKINKRISIAEPIPEGWNLGRILNWEKFFSIIEKQRNSREIKQLKQEEKNRRKQEKLQERALRKQEKENKRVDLVKIPLIIECASCNKIFETTNARKVCCCRECYNKFKYNQNLLITISKDSKTKQIKPVNYPAYKKYGWSRTN